MLAPPWIPIPAPGYGGIEAVVEALTDELVRAGHDVTLLAAPGSHSTARVRSLLSAAHPDRIGAAVFEVDHVARAFAAVDATAAQGHPYDVLHDHCGYATLAMADRLGTPVVHTMHGPFVAENAAFYAEHGHKAELVAISSAQLAGAPPQARGARVIPNPLRLRDWPLVTRKSRHVLWLGRVTDYKGPHLAVDAARRAGWRIVLAGVVQPGWEDFFAAELEPRLASPDVHFVGEVGGVAKQRLLGGAAALLMPIRWREPFGMVMIEALASGTPVIAFREGAATEVVLDGVNGFLVDDEEEMAAAMARLDEIDPVACRASVKDRYDAAVVARRYVAAYRHAATVAC
jgi:glycosyltransferase involved in cell wall biosynthesis